MKRVPLEVALKVALNLELPNDEAVSNPRRADRRGLFGLLARRALGVSPLGRTRQEVEQHMRETRGPSRRMSLWQQSPAIC